MLASFRESDLIGRVGDHEFAVLQSRDSDERDEQGPGRLETLLDEINGGRSRGLKLRARVVSVPYVAARHKDPMDLIAEAEGLDSENGYLATLANRNRHRPIRCPPRRDLSQCLNLGSPEMAAGARRAASFLVNRSSRGASHRW